MRVAAKIDANQKELVAAFRKLGCSVLHLHSLGKGAPDLAIGKCKKTVLVEVKDGSKVASKRVLTADERKFHEGWLGSLCVVEGVDDVIALVKALER